MKRAIRRLRGNTGPRKRLLRTIATRLLQLTDVSSSIVNHSASAACDECSSSRDHELIGTWPRETSVEAATLATSRTGSHLQALSNYAPRSHLFNEAPQYLTDCVTTVSTADGRYRMRSTDSADYVLPRTRTKLGEHGFCYSTPTTWNSLPSDLHDIIDTNTVTYLVFPIQVCFSAVVAISVVSELLFSFCDLKLWPMTSTFELELVSRWTSICYRSNVI